MQKRLLTIGYKIDYIYGFDNISYSNYSLKYSGEKRWANKLSKINKMILNNELQCIFIVVSRNLITDLESLGTNKFIEFLQICKQTNCIIAVQEHLLEKQPLYYDYLSEKKYSINELKEIIGKLENETKSKADKQESISSSRLSKKELLERKVFSFVNSDLREYSRKLELLLETKRIFPRAKEIIKILKHEVNTENILTFKYMNQIIRIAKDEIIEQFSNEILNIYIPKQYGYKFEFDDFIHLFERYLKNIEELNISVEINETSSGINYKFISNDKIETISDLPKKYSRFTQFVELCEKEPSVAMDILEKKNIPPERALEIIKQLSKKYKRLSLDIQQQQERLELSYKQEIQEELLELGFQDTPFSLIKNSFSIKSLDKVYQPNTEELKLINLIKTHDKNLDTDNIKSELGILNDEELKPDDRKRAAYKIKRFLSKIIKTGIEHTEKIIVESSIAYINSKIQ